MTIQSTEEQQVADTKKMYSTLLWALYGVSLSGLLCLLVLSVNRIDVLGSNNPDWMRLLLVGWIFLPVLAGIFVKIAAADAISRVRASSCTHVPEIKTFKVSSPVVTKFHVSGRRSFPVPEILLVLVIMGFVAFGEAVMNWMISSGMTLGTLTASLLGGCVLVVALLAAIVVKSIRNEKLMNEFRSEVTEGLLANGYSWGSKDFPVHPGNVYTPAVPAVLVDESGRLSNWSIQWSGEDADVIWVDPEKLASK